MKLATEKLLQNLLEITRQNLNSAELLKTKTNDSLNWKRTSESWSVLECIEHLNRYGDFYIPEMTKKIEAAKHKNVEVFKSNWLGNYFSKMVGYNEDLKKMKTLAPMNPLNSNLNIQTLEKFIEQQHQITQLLDSAKNVNLDKTKTAISISKLIKLKLGDTFRVVIFHNERHIKQAEKTFTEASK
jgi:hypothetical protein